MKLTASTLLIALALSTLAALAQVTTQPATQPTSQTATQAKPPATNPYIRYAATAPAVANPRDKLPFTNENLTGLKADLPTLFIAGDSTAATGNATTRGWAALLIDYFDPAKVNLVNRAQGGARFNGYYTSNWPQLLAAVKPGDFVVIEFGHNSGPLPGIGDETQAATGRAGGGGTPLHTHGWYLRTMIAEVRAKKATPIASTLTPRDLWKDGKVERLKEQVVGQGGMSDWTRQVAAAEKAPLVDHSNISADIFDKLGPAEAYKLWGDGYLHTNTAGAIINAEAFISGLKALPEMPLVDCLNEKGKAIPAYKPSTTSTTK
jgi:lysophospholipase L1-like esterase